MKTTTAPFLRIFLLGCVIPIIVSSIVYQGFSTNYTTQVFSEQSFKNQYENGIYRYRVLGRVLLLETYKLINSYELPALTPFNSFKLLDRAADIRFYSAYFYINTAFLCLTCIVLFFILGGHTKDSDFMNVDLPILFVCFLIAITQYVIVPYDNISYFFLATAALLILRGSPSIWNAFALCVVVVLATLTRETSSLILAFYFAHNYKVILTKPTKFNLNRQQIILLLIIFCFLITYIALRMAFGYEQAFFQEITFLKYFSIFSIAGIFFPLSIILLVFFTKTVTNEMLVFCIAALPYIVLMLLIANPWEIRLWVPIILLIIIMKTTVARSEVVFTDLGG